MLDAFATLWHGITVAGPPDLPAMTDDPTVVAIVDVMRSMMLIVGLVVVAVSGRHLIEIDPADPRFVEGFRWRTVAIMLGTLFVGLVTYARIGEPVTVTFIIAILFLLAALHSVHIAISLPRAPHPGAESLQAFVDWHDAQHRRPGA